MKTLAVLVLAGFAGGCTWVKLLQRDGCWVRQTTQWYGETKEDLGPCARPQPDWAEERHTRLLQECTAEADYRWLNLALAAWSRGEPPPSFDEPAKAGLAACMVSASAALAEENEALRQRAGEVAAERDTFRASLDQTQAYLRESHERLASSLGEAAQKPAGTATATALSTSDGNARTQRDTHLAATPAMPPGARTESTPQKSARRPSPPPECPAPTLAGKTSTTETSSNTESPPKGQ